MSNTSENTTTQVADTRQDDWSNADNYETYYSQLPIKKILQAYSIRGGLESGCDIDRVFHEIVGTNDLLEVGGGYGRVARCLIKKEYQGNIDIVERSTVLSRELEAFGDKLRVFNCDIMKFIADKHYDVVLSMWSGISDFSKEEQPQLMKKLANLLQKGGKLIMDTSIPSIKPLNAQVSDEQFYMIVIDNCLVRGYLPTKLEMSQYAEKANLKLVDHFAYETDQERERFLYVFQK